MSLLLKVDELNANKYLVQFQTILKLFKRFHTCIHGRCLLNLWERHVSAPSEADLPSLCIARETEARMSPLGNWKLQKNTTLLIISIFDLIIHFTIPLNQNTEFLTLKVHSHKYCFEMRGADTI